MQKIIICKFAKIHTKLPGIDDSVNNIDNVAIATADDAGLCTRVPNLNSE